MALLFVSDRRDVRILGISAAVAFLALNAFIALAILISTHEDFQTSAQSQASAHISEVGGVLFVLAIVTLIGVVGEWRSLAMGAFAAQIACALWILAYALSHSSHADGKLAVFALIVELTGFAAVRFGLRPTMRLADH
jgi:hypothetical protein